MKEYDVGGWSGPFFECKIIPLCLSFLLFLICAIISRMFEPRQSSQHSSDRGLESIIHGVTFMDDLKALRFSTKLMTLCHPEMDFNRRVTRRQTGSPRKRMGVLSSSCHARQSRCSQTRVQCLPWTSLKPPLILQLPIYKTRNYCACSTGYDYGREIPDNPGGCPGLNCNLTACTLLPRCKSEVGTNPDAE